jgi:hypothetical protein
LGKTRRTQLFERELARVLASEMPPTGLTMLVVDVLLEKNERQIRADLRALQSAPPGPEVEAARHAKEDAIEAGEFEKAATLRDRERELVHTVPPDLRGYLKALRAILAGAISQMNPGKTIKG